MIIEVKAKENKLVTVGDVKIGDVFSMKEYIGSVSRTTKFLRTADGFMSLENLATVSFHRFWEWFVDESFPYKDEDEQEFFEDNFDKNEVRLYESKLILTPIDN